MSKTGNEYVQTMRDKGLDDAAIKEKLASAGWRPDEINQALGQDDPDLPPPPPHKVADKSTLKESDEPKPVAVVERFSTLGVEYGVMLLSLGIGAIGLGSILHDYLNVLFGQGPFNLNPTAGAAALVGLPIFLLMFLRLHRLEIRRPQVKADGSRRRWIQATLLISFLVGIGNIIYYVYNLLASTSQPYSTYTDYASDSLTRISGSQYQMLQLLHLLITLAIAGSIFAYYWIDEHKQKQ